MNRNEYDTSYPTSYRPGHPPCHRSKSTAHSSKNDYDVESLLSARTLPSREYSRWDQRSVIDNCDRRNCAPSVPKYKRSSSPTRNHRRHSGCRVSDYDKSLDLSLRREYSPVRNSEKVRDDSFKGFTTPFPGNDSGFVNDCVDEMRRCPVEAERPFSVRSYVPSSASACEFHQEDPKYRYRVGRPPTCANDYPSKSSGNDRESFFQCANSEQRYSMGPPASIASKKRSSSNVHHWENVSTCQNTTEGYYYPLKGEQILSPQTFKRECARAYNEARAQRIRNLEEGLYGKCDWATYDSKYC